jgi:hypothetical protein
MKRGEVEKKIKEISGGGGDYLDLKDAKSAVIHIHGNLDIDADGGAEVEERTVYWVPANPDADFKPKKGGKRGGHKRRFVSRKGDDNPFQDFLDALEAAKEIDGDTVILYADGTEYTKDDILGNGDWNMDCRGNGELLYAVVASSIGDEQVSDPKLQILACKPSLAGAIDKVIAVQVRENGKEKGEAAIAGYGILVEYDNDASPSKKYTAQYNGRKPSPRVNKLLKGPGLDLAKFCGPPDADLLTEILEDTLCVAIPGLDIEPMADYEPQERTPARGRGREDRGRGGNDRGRGREDRGTTRGGGSGRDAGRGSERGGGDRSGGQDRGRGGERGERGGRDERGRDQGRGRDTGRRAEEGKDEDGYDDPPPAATTRTQGRGTGSRRPAQPAAETGGRGRPRRDADTVEEAEDQLPSEGEAPEADDLPYEDDEDPDAGDRVGAEEQEPGDEEGEVVDEHFEERPEEEEEPEGESTKLQCPECHEMTVVSAKNKRCAHCDALVIPF